MSDVLGTEEDIVSRGIEWEAEQQMLHQAVDALPEREKEIILQILSGKNRAEIAKALFLSISTIKSNIENLYKKFNVHNRVQFILYVIKNNIVELN